MRRPGKRKLVIFLADLTHTGVQIATENMPLSIGLLASYALKKIGPEIEVRLFKHPDKLLGALKHKHFDVLAASTYIWNNNLAEWACEMAKKYNPKALTIRGGWNFPLNDRQQKEYLLKHPFTDIFCINEGEEAFVGVLKRFLSVNKLADWKKEPLGSCAFLTNGSMLKGAVLPRIQDLGSIPSPYNTGLLDEFFDGKLTPIIETSRGCPFQCNYCNNSNSYYNKVNLFPIDYVRDEINYIARKNRSKGVRNLLIADTNFGMYQRDKEISHALKETQERYNWPLGIVVNTGKNNVSRIIDNTAILGNSLTISMSVQSMNKETLEAIKRDNIKISMYEEISSAMEVTGRSQVAEVIVPLPGETYKTYMQGIDKLLSIGAKRVISYTLQLNKGTIYTDDDYREKIGYEGKFRLIPYDFGIYGGRKIFDYEEVATFTNSLNFEEYIRIRKFALLMEILYSNSIFEELFRFLKEKKINNFDFLTYALDRLGKAPRGVKKVFDSFVSETISELKDSEEELKKYYADKKNYSLLKKGKIGGNVIFKHKGLMLGQYMTKWVEYVFECAAANLGVKKGDCKISDDSLELDNIKHFTSSKLDGLFMPDRTDKDIIDSFDYDLLLWLRGNGNNSCLEDFRVDGGCVKYRFYFDKKQRAERNDLFKRYGTGIVGIPKILARVPALERMFRQVKKVR